MKLAEFEKSLNAEYAPKVEQYIQEHSSVEKNKVYEEVKPSRRKYKRFIVYIIDLIWFDNSAMVRAGVWWLNEKNVPSKWDTVIVGGDIFNPGSYKLSLNQNALPHPDLQREATA